MATTTTVTSNYAGKAAGDLMNKAYNEEDTLRLGLVTPISDINYKFNLRKIRTSNGTVDYTCGHSPVGSVTLTEKVVEPKKFKNDLDICKEDFRPTWSEDLMGSSAWNDQAPKDVLDAMTASVLAEEAEAIDSKIWNGTDISGSFAGFITQFEADAAVIKANNGITPIGVAITEANVESELKKVLNVIPTEIRRNDLVIVVSPDVFQAYWFYLVSKGIANDGNTEPKQVRFGRYTLTEVNGLPDNTICVYEKKNLVFVTGLATDMARLELVDEDSIGLLTGKVRGKMVYNAAVGYYNSEEVVYYLSTTTPV